MVWLRNEFPSRGASVYLDICSPFTRLWGMLVHNCGVPFVRTPYWGCLFVLLMKVPVNHLQWTRLDHGSRGLGDNRGEASCIDLF
jgi:hypothetical protein